VSVDEVQALAQALPGPPRVIALDPTTYGETVGDVRTVAQATDAKDAALDLIARTARRARSSRPRSSLTGCARWAPTTSSRSTRRRTSRARGRG